LFNLSVLDSNFIFFRNQKHLTRRSPKAHKLSLDILLFYAHRQLRESGPPASCADGRSFLYFSSRVFQEMKVFQQINTRFHNTDTNKLAFSVQCKYSNIVNNNKNIQHCMQKWTAKSVNLELSIRCVVGGLYFYGLV